MNPVDDVVRTMWQAICGAIVLAWLLFVAKQSGWSLDVVVFALIPVVAAYSIGWHRGLDAGQRLEREAPRCAGCGKRLEAEALCSNCGDVEDEDA